MDAAVELLEKKSSQFIQLRDIADKAGVSASLLVQYFGSKEELVFEARVARLEAETMRHFGGAGEAKGGFWETLRACFEHDLAASAATRDLMSTRWWWTKEDQLRYSEATAPRTEALRRALARELETKSDDALALAYKLTTMLYAEVLRDACLADTPPEEASRQLKALLAPALEAHRNEKRVKA